MFMFALEPGLCGMSHVSESQIEKFKMKIDTAEFDGEASKESMTERLALFAELVKAQLAAATQLAAVAPKNTTITPETARLGTKTGQADVTDDPDMVAAYSTAPVSDDVFTRVFRRNDDAVSLLALPRTETPEGDALVVLLYG